MSGGKNVKLVSTRRKLKRHTKKLLNVSQRERHVSTRRKLKTHKKKTHKRRNVVTVLEKKEVTLESSKNALTSKNDPTNKRRRRKEVMRARYQEKKVWPPDEQAMITWRGGKYISAEVRKQNLVAVNVEAYLHHIMCGTPTCAV